MLLSDAPTLTLTLPAMQIFRTSFPFRFRGADGATLVRDGHVRAPLSAIAAVVWLLLISEVGGWGGPLVL